MRTMGFFRKKHDPISEKAQALNKQIQALESEIQRISAEAAVPPPRFRSSTLPRSYSPPLSSVSAREPSPRDHFEDVDHRPLQAEPQPKKEKHDEMGVRKYDLGGAWQRFKDSLKTPPASNPKLVNY